MLQVGNKPILEHIIDRFIMQGFENFNISVYYKAEQITEYFGDGSNKNIKIKYLFEEEPMGTAGCLSLLSTQTDHNLPVILTNGDILTNIDYRALLDFHKSQKADITMCVRKLSINVPFGVVNLDQSRLISLEEKPDIDFTINAGIYVINNNILKKVKPERIDMTEIIENLMVKGKTVCGFPLIENWVDIGHHDELKRAQQFLKD
jgi:NDP-sugar pyrophosphorylase family protein